MGIPNPFLLQPVGKDYLWGGNRLNDEFGKKIYLEPLAETWECSTHPDGVSIVASGEYFGMKLDKLLKLHPEYLGTHPKRHLLPKGQLPILIKFIDANQNLSVQVHPSDEYAEVNEDGKLGKVEMWYVVDASKEAKLVYGLLRDIDERQLQCSINEGTFEKYLRYVPVEKNNVFFIDSGTIHAIGAGIIVAEIQENSNLTYRLYDYNRTDKNGRKRELHINKALDVANLSGSATVKQPLRVLKYRRGCAIELLSRCKYFQVERMLLNTARVKEMIDFQTDSTSFQVLLCVDGCGTLFFNDMNIPFFKGDCIFVPACSQMIKIHGKGQFLKVSC